MGRTGFHTHTAADTLGMVGLFGDIDIHFACLCTSTAGYTFIFVHLHLKKRYPIQKRIKCAQRTQPFAERTVEQHAQHNRNNQDAELPREQ